jgi:hypothetical protein
MNKQQNTQRAEAIKRGNIRPGNPAFKFVTLADAANSRAKAIATRRKELATA